MSKLRSVVVWLVLYTQVWTPVLAQTLPISVDKNVAGQRPVVGTANGVPVVNIAPPSAGGVSNNRFTQFNVGPSGVVLNNSGAASQTQLAGQVAGNPMLGNQRAATILNQVTANNPSRLMGMLEVAGNRANVIVANPAGITCNGCGFLNANRATLTTGKPVIGPDGTLGFDIASGRLAIEGAGLYGANLSQVDLLARTLELNAQVWADRLNVVAGSARVGYDGIDVSALAGDGAGTGVALDVAALGGMYANSIRLIGTEAGVGVNVGGNLAALTGTLSVSANGDVRILPSGRLQAATDLSVRSGRDIINDGTATAGGALALNAAGKFANNSAMSSGAGASIVARQMENRGAFTAGLRSDGTISPLGALSVRVDQLLNPGSLVAGGDATVTAGVLGLSGGKFVAGGLLTLDASGAISNRGGAVYGGSVALRAANLDNTAGKLTSGGALEGRVAGVVDNTGGTLAGAGAVDISGKSLVNAAGGVVSGDSVALRGNAGIDNQGGSVQANGALRVETAGALDNRGGKLLGGSAEIQAASLDNRAGVAQADGKLAIDNTGALRNQGGGLYGGSADLKTGSLENAGGRIATGGALDLNADGAVDNIGGTIAAQGQATLNAQRLANTRGIVAASGLTLKTQGVLDNSGGLIQADNALALDAGSVNNRDTLANGIAGAGGTTAGTLGLMGKQVTLNTGSVDNQAGRIGAGQDLALTTGTLENARGNVSSDAKATLAFTRLANTGGALTAGASLELVTGNLDNDGKIHSGQDLKITADTLTNRAGGELIAVRNNELVIGGLLANAGLIDGGYTRITAGNLVNTGRIYGDRIGIQTPLLQNEPNAVIASRGDMDLGVGTLTNREHALIYAAGDLRIGGALDGTGKAAGQATLLANESATIEAERNADIAAASIQNRNLHFASETVEVGRGPKLYYRLENSTEFLDGSKLWLCDAVTELCGRDPVTFLEDDSERRLLLPSTKYPESRYGPPFDYFKGQRGKAGVSAPIPPAWLPDQYVCDGPGGDAGGSCATQPGGPRYKAGERIWSVFDVAEPVAVPPMVEQKCNGNQICLVSTPEREQALALNKARHDELAGKIYAFNADFNSRLVKNFFYYKVEEVVMESRTLSTDPAKIIVGGAATFTGTVTNDKSRIVAGGTLSVVGPAINNLGAEGVRSIERTGIEVRTVGKGQDRNESTSDYKDVVAPQRIELAVASSDGNTAPPQTGNRSPGASAIANIQAPARVLEVGLPGKGVIRVVTLPPTVPTNTLYRVMTAPEAPYLIATDSRFLGQRQPVSSDFLLQKINQDSGHILKRLGDGFYEQKLVAEQIMLATGQRFVGDYTDNETQYKALLAAGADFATQYGLTVGTALTEDQMRHLTSDIVWLVEQTVTLPDGSQQTVLTPQVYLAVKPGDLRGDGTLIAGRDTRINTSGDVNNSGTIGARNALIVEAENVRNTVGSMQGKTVNLAARNDIENLAGLLKGDKVALSAGRDVNLKASTQSNASGGVSSTRVDGVARIDAGDLNVQAGRDVNAQAAGISATGDARVQAGNDINLTTEQERYAESYDYGKKNRSEMRSATEVGSRIVAGGNLTLIAGQDVNARAAEVTSDKQLAVGAGRDINVVAGTDSNYAYSETYYKKRGFLSSKSEHRKTESDWTTSASSTFTGDSAVLMAGRDLNVVGSNVAAQNDLVMSADRNVNIVAAQNTSEEYQYEKVKKSGFGAMGGLSYGSRQQTDILDGDKVLHTASTVGSVQGNALINAGKSLNVVGSNVLARQGDVTLIGRDVNIAAAVDTAREKEFHEVKQSGLSINASTPLLSAMQTAGKMSNAAGKTDNKVMQGLALATTGLAGVNAYDAIQADPRAAGGLNISIDLGSSKSQSTTKRESASVRGSTVAAGRDLTVIAQGGGQASNVTVTGSSLSAGNNAAIKADGDIALRAAQNTFEQHSTNKSTNASIGVGVTVGSQGVGFTLNVAASAARGKADGKDTSWTSSTVTAGKVLGLQSGGDTSLIGAIGQADRIVASVGNNLRIETLQDISTYASKQQSAGIAGSLCYGYCTSTISGNVSQGQMKSNFKSASEQAGLKAGDGGFIVDVKNNTTLIGGLIASSDKAVAEGLNTLATGTLVTENLKNSASYKASQVGISGGYGWGGSGGKDGGKDAGLGTDAKGNVAGGSKAQPGTSVPQTSGGLGMGTPVVAAASGRDSSTTYSAISGGTVLIRDEVAQQNLTGMTAAETIASLNRDTSSDTLNALKPIFDKEKIEAGFEIVAESQRQVGQFLTNRAKEAKALEDALKNEPEGPRRDQLRQALEDAKTWGPGGESRRWLTAILGAVSGNVTGATGDAIQAVAVNYLQGLAASQVKEIVSALGDGPQAEAARAAMHAIVGCAGAAGKGSDCSAGALGAGSGAVINALLSGDASKMTPEEKEVRRNLVGSLVAGIAQASGVSGAEAVFAATNETENNYLKPDELKSYLAALQAWKECSGDVCAQAKKEVRRLQAISTERNYAADSACLENPGACAAAAQELRADITALEVQANSLDRTEAATAANNLLQARKQYYSNLEWRAYAAQQELEAAGKGSWLASMSGQELYESGHLTQQEAQDLQAMRRETFAAAFVPPALAAGVKGGGSAAGRRIQSVAEEAKASALGGAKATGGKPTVELFGGKNAQTPGAINVDIRADIQSGIRTDATKLPFKDGSLGEVIATNPYMGPGGKMMSFLPEATRVVEPGGKIYINANAANPYGKLPSQAELDSLGLRVVQNNGGLDSRFAGQTFMQSDGVTPVKDVSSMRTIILERIK
ncbi:Filamentous hemagglutinin [Achromobacter xylosoxidans]|uniref:hemagglutinin repeat-containing protein n=1 Tax=Alcaligenes xylosoxydans xylosoxydans TaxID=85698 RepID=UPI0006C2E396|nr:hemagglutinin repeat-containing protein [Achromobacter xylosoxidans]CUI76875.1 Filamentous hemagglutinin [Achromobacter xylosoxidans]CUJ58602.1 Filamentous hemagglutinin [Achromobacter xylosoxidans]